jgi:hypothetical protein
MHFSNFSAKISVVKTCSNFFFLNSNGMDSTKVYCNKKLENLIKTIQSLKKVEDNFANCILLCMVLYIQSIYHSAISLHFFLSDLATYYLQSRKYF